MNLDELNTTELAQLASNLNENAHRGLPREVLAQIVMGEELDLPSRQVDAYRDAIFQFCDSNWKQLEPLLSCPMKTREPRACYTCTDIQVAECTLQNRRTIPFTDLVQED
jgi:hypothetical protein